MERSNYEICPELLEAAQTLNATKNPIDYVARKIFWSVGLQAKSQKLDGTMLDFEGWMVLKLGHLSA